MGCLKNMGTTNSKGNHLAHSNFLAGAGASLQGTQKSFWAHRNITPVSGNVPPNKLPALLASSLQWRQLVWAGFGQQFPNDPAHQSRRRGQGNRKCQQKTQLPSMSSNPDSLALLTLLFLPFLPLKSSKYFIWESRERPLHPGTPIKGRERPSELCPPSAWDCRTMREDEAEGGGTDIKGEKSKGREKGWTANFSQQHQSRMSVQ